MAGGALQWPLWVPYEIYASIDYVYGWPAWEAGEGFAAAVMTASKTLLYFLNEACSGWKNVAHNEWTTLVPLYFMMK
jgi:hypothetical protein